MRTPLYELEKESSPSSLLISVLLILSPRVRPPPSVPVFLLLQLCHCQEVRCFAIHTDGRCSLSNLELNLGFFQPVISFTFRPRSQGHRDTMDEVHAYTYRRKHKPPLSLHKTRFFCFARGIIWQVKLNFLNLSGDKTADYVWILRLLWLIIPLLYIHDSDRFKMRPAVHQASRKNRHLFVSVSISTIPLGPVN